ncbi:hypothetical protein [Halorhodospira halochloris]|uniref:hypothetical protein n=1 Tax=Halorhodospira halochloris TaxID=1052 RepID=UPI001EE97429|nr:hypothetical protein [Halorhodospira halochloris]MCG5548515.1 hypothetical protein [Halorhodospira halochloris]
MLLTTPFSYTNLPGVIIHPGVEQSSTAEEINRNITNIRDVANETQNSFERVQHAVEQQKRLVE